MISLEYKSYKVGIIASLLDLLWGSKWTSIEYKIENDSYDELYPWETG